MDKTNRETSFKNTGAVEQDRPEQKTNVAPMTEQLDHTWQDPLNKVSDSGMPYQGQTPEFTGEKQEGNDLERDTDAKLPEEKQDRDEDIFRSEGEEIVDQDPGERQKKNQNQKSDDDLAA